MLVSGEHAVELEKGDEKKNLGKAKVFYSQKKMQSEITSQILGTLLQTAILSLIILIVTAFALTRTVLKPVQKATKIIQNFAAGEFNTHSEFDKKNGDDEISTMVQMLTTLGTFLRSRAENAAALSEGNLLIQVQLASERDIMGREFEKMVQGLTEKVKTIRSCANTVLEDGNQISKATEELSQNAVRQAAALEEISSTLTEIDAKTKENSKNATALAESARESTQVATTGNERAQELASALAEIANAGKKVTGIVKIIDDIAFQTNLLALNAAVEAARAGKHGKGFAVVADEVRNLATRSAEAVAQTTTVIAKMQESTKQGSAVSSKLNDVILNILANAQSVHATANNVAAASEQQASSITQVTTGIHQIEGAVQQSAASTEEVGSTTAMLRQEMNRLASSVSAFRID
jgi:methyl-accepting chemotaxis protein